jgi:hypothetical protein
MIEIISEYANVVMAWYGAIVACASIIVKLTPTPKDDSFLEKVVNFFDNFSVVNTKKNQEKLDK